MPPIAQRAVAMMGSYVGNLQELKEVVALAKKKKIKRAPVTTIPADQVNKALEDLKAGKVLGRVVLDLEHATA
jgi:alcohol dehydrogenase/propanol-preferring alcohol dehydrogenase